MIREELRKFGVTTEAQPLLWACLRECPWEEGGHPFHPFKYNVPFWGPPGLYLPHVQSLSGGSQSIYHRILFELACFF
jgi:hypothetical protein